MGSNQILSRSKEQLLTLEAQSFNYASLKNETRVVVQRYASEIKSLMQNVAQDIINIGQKLTEVKQQLGHGNFRNWLKVELGWSVSTALRFMQVSEQFKCINLTHLEIAASALYLLAAPSTPAFAREEALERATQGEAISYTMAKTIVNRYKEVAKLKAHKTVTVDALSETAFRNSSISTKPYPATQHLVTQTVESQSAVVEQSKDKLPGKHTENLVYYQVSNRSHDMVPDADSSDYSPKNQAEIEIQSLFGVGNLIRFTGFGQQEPKWLGQVAEVKEATATEVEVVIRFSLQPLTGVGREV